MFFYVLKELRHLINDIIVVLSVIIPVYADWFLLYIHVGLLCFYLKVGARVAQ
jgi:hypothetical protein